MKIIHYLFTVCCISSFLVCCNQKKEIVPSVKDISDSIYVPNQETAIKIAEAVWVPIYGDKIYNQ